MRWIRPLWSQRTRCLRRLRPPAGMPRLPRRHSHRKPPIPLVVAYRLYRKFDGRDMCGGGSPIFFRFSIHGIGMGERRRKNNEEPVLHTKQKEREDPAMRVGVHNCISLSYSPLSHEVLSVHQADPAQPHHLFGEQEASVGEGRVSVGDSACRQSSCKTINPRISTTTKTKRAASKDAARRSAFLQCNRCIRGRTKHKIAARF